MLADLAGLDALMLLAAEGGPAPEGVAFLRSSSSGGLSARLRWPLRPRRAHRGIVHSRLGHHQQASEHLDEALTICRETGDRSSEAETLNSLGEILLAAGRPGDAQAQQTMALGLASQIDNSYEQARAHDGLGHAHHAADDLGKAREHWQEAMTLYGELGVPEADLVRTQLIAAADGVLPEP
jgi:tetratricopeptide (TPR) repeat protein